MGFHKDTKFWSKHDVSEGAFTGTIQTLTHNDLTNMPTKSLVTLTKLV